MYTQIAARERHLNNLLSTSDALIKSAYNAVNKTSQKQLVLTVFASANKTEQLLAAQLKIRSFKVSEQYAKALASNMLVEGAVQKDWWATQAEILRQKFTRQMREGLSYGENLSDLIRRIRGRRENQWLGHFHQTWLSP